MTTIQLFRTGPRACCAICETPLAKTGPLCAPCRTEARLLGGGRA